MRLIKRVWQRRRGLKHLAVDGRVRPGVLSAGPIRPAGRESNVDDRSAIVPARPAVTTVPIPHAGSVHFGFKINGHRPFGLVPTPIRRQQSRENLLVWAIRRPAAFFRSTFLGTALSVLSLAPKSRRQTNSVEQDMNAKWKFLLVGLLVGAVVVLAAGRAMRGKLAADAPQLLSLPGDADALIKERNLNPDDVAAALATYQPSGRHDDYVMFSSGGHSGQVIAIGIPSMRILKNIAVFSPDSWSGYGVGVKETALDDYNRKQQPNRAPLTWGDTHHPALSETGGEYDGEFLFINDKANGRIAVVDLKDFETKQILANPIYNNNHGSTMVTPDTEYVIEGSQYAVPLGHKYAPIERYKEEYRGLITFWKFDRKRGRIDESQSFALEVPPYWQDLSDCGKKISDGWIFINSINTELATGGVESGKPPFEAGVSRGDTDLLHAINWRKVEQLARTGQSAAMNGMKLITLKEAVDAGAIYFIAEPKSPHGVDISPTGKYIVVSGKLDPHVTVFAMDKILAAINAMDFEGNDAYGVPILKFDSVKEAQVELGLGPLHTQFDDKGYAYTSLFLDNAVVRWTMGGSEQKAAEGPWKVVQSVKVQYNVGHIAAAEGDTVSPDGKYLVALNKWSVDRFPNIGPLLPQNLQLIDISRPGDRCRVIYDLPLGMAEPHYSQIIKADKLKCWEVYPQIGWDAHVQAKNPSFPANAKDFKWSIVNKGDTTEITMLALRSHFEPEHVKIKKGQKVKWTITSMESSRDSTHGFCIPSYNIAGSIEPGKMITVEFVADKAGVFPFYCLEFCSALHLEMMGYLMVEP
jgi:nitrous-oxide reductase